MLHYDILKVVRTHMGLIGASTAEAVDDPERAAELARFKCLVDGKYEEVVAYNGNDDDVWWRSPHYYVEKAEAEHPKQ